ncbi:hypothetical protein C8F04DRAFT_1248483 [Mycena alexandri]|uniref:Uncharacterized protein n=1 Tax=Mycena alexandri TaxID=1745969 RepID=A0AAD6TGM4_9AGAR|nr:hypothetical protein C8F04DRAFT_1248456 [Mycena alexandri]KAJ7046227.1 hypothetical protein C8F04DRAFT_1248483 [Mycena alexandri]
MTGNSANAINVSTPEQELQALIAKLADLSQVSLALAKQCLDVQTRLPAVIDAAIDAAVTAQVPAPIAPILVWIPLVPRTPDEVEDTHLPATEDSVEKAYHVVTTGREPGLYDNIGQSNYQVLGVPNAQRRKITGLHAALAYYRAKYTAQEVTKWGPQPAPNAPPTAASTSTTEWSSDDLSEDWVDSP